MDTPEHAPPAGGVSPADSDRIEALERQVQDLDERVERYRLVHDTWTLIVFAIAAVTLIASVVAIGIAMRAVDDAEQGTSFDTTPVAEVASGATATPARTENDASTPRTWR